MRNIIVHNLVADTFGTHIGKYSQRLRITQQGETLAEAPLLHLQSILVTSSGVSISADALAACSEHGIPVYFVDGTGTPYAALYNTGLIGTIVARREQLLAYYDARGIGFTLAIAEGKIRNQATNLKYLAKTRETTAPELHQELHLQAGEVMDCIALLDNITDENLDDLRSAVMGAEGLAAKRYWEAAGLVLPEEYQWPGRVGRGAKDPLNSLLNYGYGILYGKIEQAILLAGLDPYAGFLHADRPGKPSLVLDLIEEFRQAAIDRLVLGLANRHFTVHQDDKGLLTKETQRGFADKVFEHLEAMVRYDGKRYPLRFVIQNQARHLASFLRGECPTYVPFKAIW